MIYLIWYIISEIIFIILMKKTDTSSQSRYDIEFVLFLSLIPFFRELFIGPVVLSHWIKS